MDDYNEEGQSQISTYNEAVFQIKRLNELWLRAELFATRGIFNRWSWVLDSIFRELYPDIQKMKDKNTKIKQHNFYMTKLKHSKSRQETYFYLDKRHQLIKLLQDTVGKGAIYKDADDELPD